MLLNPDQARALLAHALENQYAILAVNADSHAAVIDCLEAARSCDAPIIIETSLWQLQGHSYGRGDALLGAARYLADLQVLAGSERYSDIPVIFHTDHIKGPIAMQLLCLLIEGYPLISDTQKMLLHPSTISLDASELTDEENIASICKLALAASAAGKSVTLEMESAVDDEITPPGKTKKLIGSVEEQYPGVIHLWAPGLGTQHGFSAEGFPEFSVDHVTANVELLEQLTGRRIGLALHGSSGLPAEQLSAAAQAGVIKVNWSSESLAIRSQAAQEFYQTHSEQLQRSHKQWKTTAMDNGLQSYISKAYIPIVEKRISLLHGSGQASSFISQMS